MRHGRPLLAFVILVTLGMAGPAAAQNIVVNNSSLPLFEQIPAAYVTAAAQFRMMFLGRSVGTNIDSGIECLSTPYASSASSCRSTPSGVSPETWSGTYPRSNWTYWGWPGVGLPNPVTCDGSDGLWTGYQPCFLSFVQPRLSQWDVMSFQFDYLTGVSGNLPDYFVAHSSNRDIFDFEAFTQSIAPKRTIQWTTSLMKSDAQSPGALARLHGFNVAMRAWAAQGSGRVLVDIADIISRRPDGTQCLAPDNVPRICDEYSNEQFGGHLTSGWARVRVAKAVWIALARMAGWTPSGGGGGGQVPAPFNLRIIS